MKFSAVILAGGQSRRMGCDKAWLLAKGQPLLARQIELVRSLGPVEVFISGRADTNYGSLGCPVLHDRFPDSGPLGGIERALEAASTPLLLVLAVDLPEMNATILRPLAARCTDDLGVVPRVDGRIEPLAAFYPKAAHRVAATLLNSGSKAATALADRCVQSGLATFVDLSAQETAWFKNWNSPADLDQPQSSASVPAT